MSNGDGKAGQLTIKEQTVRQGKELWDVESGVLGLRSSPDILDVAFQFRASEFLYVKCSSYPLTSPVFCEKYIEKHLWKCFIIKVYDAK